MGRRKGGKNAKPYPECRSKNFYWKVVSRKYTKELQAFKGMHNRVRDGKSPSIFWGRDLEGFVEFLREVGKIPLRMNKPSIGRINHSKGYRPGNICWEPHSINSIKRRGTRYES